jgi:hypothetical protein
MGLFFITLILCLAIDLSHNDKQIDQSMMEQELAIKHLSLD